MIRDQSCIPFLTPERSVTVQVTKVTGLAVLPFPWTVRIICAFASYGGQFRANEKYPPTPQKHSRQKHSSKLYSVSYTSEVKDRTGYKNNRSGSSPVSMMSAPNAKTISLKKKRIQKSFIYPRSPPNRKWVRCRTQIGPVLPHLESLVQSGIAKVVSVSYTSEVKDRTGYKSNRSGSSPVSMTLARWNRGLRCIPLSYAVLHHQLWDKWKN